MLNLKPAIIAITLALTGCVTTKTVTVIDKQYVAVKVSPALFEIENPPKPPVRKDFKGTTAEDVTIVFSEKIQDLYIYIAKLQAKIIKIQKAQNEIADRIENKEVNQ